MQTVDQIPPFEDGSPARSIPEPRIQGLGRQLVDELQLPLAGIVGLAEILLETTDPTGLSYYDLRTLLRFAEQCQEAVERFRSAARLDARDHTAISRRSLASNSPAQ